jgi:Ser/Thr protein kinase RdoA (MazF antagonist)
LDSPSPNDDVLTRWDLRPQRYLGGRVSQHWLVESRGVPLVLRCSSDADFSDVPYELDILQRLRGLGWQVPEPVRDPHASERQTWCLFTWLAGEPRAVDSPAEGRERGRLLAELHDALASFSDMPQRDGFRRSDEVLRDPALIDALEQHASVFPGEARMMRQYVERGLELFAQSDVSRAELIPIHSDFARWNLLFEGKNLTGILDFEFTHLNYRVADFALAWRGDQDEVIAGYEEVHRLTDVDWQLLLPAYWSWLFLGVKDAVTAMTAGQTPAHSFDWQIRHLTKRSQLLGSRVPHYVDLPVETG